jgi:DNA polymerase III subunit gamma/tau
MLGTVDREHAVRLLDAVAAGDGPRILAEMAVLDERVPDYGDVLGTIAALVQRAAVLQAAPDLDDDEDGLTERARPLANTTAPEDLQLWYQVAVAGRRDLPLAPSPRAGCEMVLLRMLAFRFAAPGELRAGPVPAVPENAARTQSAAQSAQPGQRAPAVVAQPAARPAPRAAAAAGAEDWEQMVERMGLSGATRQLARHCSYDGRAGGVVRLSIDPAHEILATSAQQERLREALSRHFGETMRLQLDLKKPTVETPAEREQRAAAERQRQAEHAIEEDPLVREMQKVFDATVDRDSIRPAD